MSKQRAPFGTWKSPISPTMLAGEMRLQDVQWDSDGETIVWLERRDGVNRLVAQTGHDAMRDITTTEHSVGGRVGYGGGGFTVYDGVVIFVAEGRLWRVAIAGGMPKAITPKFGGCAAPSISADGRWVAFVHTYEERDVVAIVDSMGDYFPTIVAQGDDFVMQPTWHPDGTHLAYVAWNHPNMPWNGSELRIVELAYDRRGTPYTLGETTLAGNRDTAIFQPIFSPDGTTLAYVSDEENYGHIYLYDIGTGQHQRVTQERAEHGLPAWIQGMRTMAWSGDGRRLYYIRSQEAFYSVWRYDRYVRQHTRLRALDEYTHSEQISVARQRDEVTLIGSASRIGTRLLHYSAEKDFVRIVRRATSERLPSNALSQAEPISWVGEDGERVYGLFYLPSNAHYTYDGGAPLMVLVHGGPTSQRSARYDPEAQFFTSRGYAVLQVNHRGSTGYGKAYLNRLRGAWGKIDVEDSLSGAHYLIKQGKADADKVIIMGGSAGGYTVLQALTDYPGFFKAGICSYGIANQFSLVMDTHKFESRYNDWLLGSLPEAAPLYRERSPLFKADSIRDALILFQGEEDRVVPKNQADAIVGALRRRGVTHEYHVYEGEGHGWSKPATIADFYSKIETFLLTQVIYV